MLQGRADSLLGAVQDSEDAEDNVMLDGTEMTLPSEDIYEVRDDDGRFLGRSHNWDGAPSQLFVSHVERPTEMVFGNRRYRVLVLHGMRIVDPGDKDGGRPRHVTIVYGSPISRLWKIIFGAVRFYALSSLALMAITALVMAWLLQRALAPLRELATEASKVSSTSWTFQPSEAVRSVQELAPLHIALETLVQGLERAFLQQQRFTSDAAHELKTAVAVVKSSLQLLSMKERTPEEYQAGLERCQQDCARMEEITFKMLALARAEHSAGSASIGTSGTSLTSCIWETVDQLSPMIELRRIHIEQCISAETTVVLSMEECSLLCSNLLLNAVQHSKPGGDIVISAEQRGSQIELQIRDNGDGIATEDLGHIFERFYRGDPSRNRNTGGAGLGLAICKALVEQVGGSIRMESQLGVGTTAIVSLPVAAQGVTGSQSPSA